MSNGPCLSNHPKGGNALSNSTTNHPHTPSVGKIRESDIEVLHWAFKIKKEKKEKNNLMDRHWFKL